MSEQPRVNWRPDDVLRAQQERLVLVDRAGQEYRVYLERGGNWALDKRQPRQTVIERADVWAMCYYLNECEARALAGEVRNAQT